MSIAIHYSAIRAAPASDTIYGLQVAVEDWMRAYFRHASARDFRFLVSDEQSQAEISAIAAETGIDPARLCFLDARFPRENGGDLTLVFRPDLDPHDLFWQRETTARPGYAFCGLAHAIAGRDGGTILSRYVYGPSGAGDTILCPSRAIRQMIETYFAGAAQAIEQRFQGRFVPQIDLPLVPLGFDPTRITKRIGPEKRAAQRELLAISDDSVVLLWVGRLSALTKAHPIAMFRAAELAAQRTGKHLHLLMQGYFIPAGAEADFKNLAHDVCPSVTVTFVAANDARFPDGLWAAGDIFLSLIDNVQESFGLTPIEAIAAGLPRVISDWDGYRDCVTDGQDGFLIPTLQPPPGMGIELAELFLADRETYGVVLGKTALSVAVDAEAAAKAIAALAQDPALRNRMAEAAKKRLPAYAWDTIIAATEAVWANAVEKRRGIQVTSTPRLPIETPDPFTLYQGFPSATLTAATRFALCADKAQIKKLWGHGINVLAGDLMLPPNALTNLINHLAAHPQLSVEDLQKTFPTMEAARLSRTLVWLVKLGILEISPPQSR